MNTLKTRGLLAIVLALGAIGPTTASAAQFTASMTGSLSGKALESQVLTTNSGQLKCHVAATTGTITEPPPLTQQHITVQYSGCSFFGIAGLHISPATYLLTSSGQVHLQNTVTISVTLGGCSIAIIPQTINTFDYATIGSKMKVTPTAAGMHYKGSGGICGSTTLSNMTYSGAFEIERVGGGSFTYDP